MNDMPYIRVGTSYFKKVKAPTIAGDFNEILVPWNIDTIKQDYGKTISGIFLNTMVLPVFPAIRILNRFIPAFTTSIPL